MELSVPQSKMSALGPTETVWVYSPHHSMGYFNFLDCSRLHQSEDMFKFLVFLGPMFTG